MEAYKGFNGKLQCTAGGEPYQYEVGKTYEEPEADLCRCGFHACENPMDVFYHYAPSQGRYCKVDLDDVTEQTHTDSKRAGKKITIKEEIGISGVVQAGVKFVLDHAKWDEKNTATGDYSGASATGDYSGASATGDYSGASAVGYGVQATVGPNGVACAVGIGGKCRGAKGALLVLTEYTGINGDIVLKDAKLARVDGKNIEENTFYALQNGEIVEVD